MLLTNVHVPGAMLHTMKPHTEESPADANDIGRPAAFEC